MAHQTRHSRRITFHLCQNNRYGNAVRSADVECDQQRFSSLQCHHCYTETADSKSTVCSDTQNTVCNGS